MAIAGLHPIEVLLRFTPIVAIVAAMLIRVAILDRQQRRRRALETPRLATMLVIELQSLRSHYEENLLLLRIDNAVLLSLRPPGAAFRSNLGRLPALFDTRIVAPLTTVYAHHDRIEALMQACQRPPAQRKPAGAMDAALLAALATRLGTGTELVEAAICAITEAWPVLTNPAPEPMLLDEEEFTERLV